MRRTGRGICRMEGTCARVVGRRAGKQAGRGPDSPEGGVQQRGVVDWAAVVVIRSGDGDSSGGGRVRRRRYVGARCLVRVIASSRRLSSLCGGMKIGLASTDDAGACGSIAPQRAPKNFDMTPRNQLGRQL